MYECWALISVYPDYPREWVKGWDVGTYKSTGATAFRPEFDMEKVYYVAEEDLCYSRFPKGMCEECLMIGSHKFTCETRRKERKNDKLA